MDKLTGQGTGLSLLTNYSYDSEENENEPIHAQVPAESRQDCEDSESTSAHSVSTSSAMQSSCSDSVATTDSTMQPNTAQEEHNGESKNNVPSELLTLLDLTFPSGRKEGNDDGGVVDDVDVVASVLEDLILQVEDSEVSVSCSHGDVFFSSSASSSQWLGKTEVIRKVLFNEIRMQIFVKLGLRPHKSWRSGKPSRRFANQNWIFCSISIGLEEADLYLQPVWEF